MGVCSVIKLGRWVWPGDDACRQAAVIVPAFAADRLPRLQPYPSWSVHVMDDGGLYFCSGPLPPHGRLWVRYVACEPCLPVCLVQDPGCLLGAVRVGACELGFGHLAIINRVRLLRNIHRI